MEAAKLRVTNTISFNHKRTGFCGLVQNTCARCSHGVLLPAQWLFNTSTLAAAKEQPDEPRRGLKSLYYSHYGEDAGRSGPAAASAPLGLAI